MDLRGEKLAELLFRVHKVILGKVDQQVLREQQVHKVQQDLLVHKVFRVQ